jgi:hypothetical protein
MKMYHDVVKFIKPRTLRWAGHVMRTDESDPARKVDCTEPGGTGDRKRDRAKLRWCDESDEDVAQVGCRNWRLNAQSRQEWRKLIEGVKFHPGMQHH